MRLARVGIEAERGYLQGGVSAWKQAGFPIGTLDQISVQDLHKKLPEGGVHVLDVRREGEWMAGHIAEAAWWPLDKFNSALPLAKENLSIAVHCKSGYRSMIACSLLQRAGFQNVINVVGGLDGWQQAGLPVVSGTPVVA